MKFAHEMRNAARALKEFSVNDLSGAIEIRSYKERRIMRSSLNDFLRRGEMERIARGRYRYIPIQKPLTLRQRIWDIARRMIRFSIDDVEQITEGNRETIKKFCAWMVTHGYAKRIKRGQFKITGTLKPVVPKGS